ncbi:MAG: DUF2062 domain-containing protein [Halalkalicoccus sp.]
MVRERLVGYRAAVREEFEALAAEDHPPGDIAGSFAIGVFITALPTLGTGLLLFVVLAALFERVSKLALFASLLVFNPVAKWGVYAASFWLGTLLLGPAPELADAEVSMAAGSEVVARLVVGNVLLAVVFTVVGYTLALRLVLAYRERNADATDLLPDRFAE